MIHGLLWFPLLLVFLLLTSLGWLERRRQSLYILWAKNSELSKLDGSGAARLNDGKLTWSTFEAGTFKEQGSFEITKLELIELMAFKLLIKWLYKLLINCIIRVFIAFKWFIKVFFRFNH